MSNPYEAFDDDEIFYAPWIGRVQGILWFIGIVYLLIGIGFQECPDMARPDPPTAGAIGTGMAISTSRPVRVGVNAPRPPNPQFLTLE